MELPPKYQKDMNPSGINGGNPFKSAKQWQTSAESRKMGLDSSGAVLFYLSYAISPRIMISAFHFLLKSDRIQYVELIEKCNQFDIMHD